MRAPPLGCARAVTGSWRAIPSRGFVQAAQPQERDQGRAVFVFAMAAYDIVRASLSVVEACVSFDRFVLRKSASPLRPGSGGAPEPSLGRKLFIDPGLQQSPVDRKMLRAQQPLHLRQSEQRTQKALRDLVREQAVAVLGARFLENVDASKTFSSIESPTNQRNSMSNSIRSTNCRSERIVWRSCDSVARSNRSRGMDGRPIAW